MTTRNKPIFVASALLLSLGLAGWPAQAHDGWHRRGGGSVLGAVVAGAVVGAAVGAMMAPPPPPPPYAVRVYGPPPPPVYVPAPAPVVYAEAPPSYQPVVGLSLSGVVDSVGRGGAIAGTAGALQLRTSPHSMFSLELQSLQGDRTWDGMKRDDLDALLGLRLYLWNAWLTPYLDGAVGFGRASFQCCAYRDSAAQFLGRYGLGLELRLGRHLAFDGEIAQVHRVRLDSDTGPPLPLDDHETGTELRGGIAFRF